jgi:hypothetical protein
MTKKERKKYELLPPKIAESDTVSLGHGLCGSVGSIYNKDTSQNILYASLIALTMIDPATVWFEIECLQWLKSVIQRFTLTFTP